MQDSTSLLALKRSGDKVRRLAMCERAEMLWAGFAVDCLYSNIAEGAVDVVLTGHTAVLAISKAATEGTLHSSEREIRVSEFRVSLSAARPLVLPG